MDPIVLSTTLAAPIDTVWNLVRRPALLEHVARGRLSFRPISPPAFPEVWEPGTYRAALKGFGVVPLGWQEIGVSFPETGTPERQVRDLGRSPIFQVWDHLIRLEPVDDTTTRYTDEIRFETRLPQWLVTPIVRDFYRHRQSRWRKLIAAGGQLPG